MSAGRDARAFARAKESGLVEGVGAEDRLVPLAFTVEGEPLLPAARAAEGVGSAVRLALASEGSVLHIEGKLAEAAEAGPRLQAVHPSEEGPALRIEVQAVDWKPATGEGGRLDAEAWLLPTPEWKAGEAGINSHMNEDHEDAMQRMCRVHHGFDPARAELVAVDPEGLLIRGDGRLAHVAFDTPAHSMDDVHQATVRVARKARQAEGG